MPQAKHPLEDNIFGGMDKPAKACAYQREHTRGIHHYGRKTPSRPQPSKPLCLHASSSSEVVVQSLHLEYSLDNWITQQEAAFSKADLRWDSLSWGWIQAWELSLPAFPADTLLRYRVYALTPEGSRSYAESQSAQAEQAQQYALWYDPAGPPAWAAEARVYQVFVDRFNPGGGRAWLQTEKLDQICGGTLAGVSEKLPNIAALGFNAVWLTPIFASPSHHGYDSTDYTAIEPRLGSEDDLRRLIDQAHALGIRVILDFVANHSSDRHAAFQAAREDPRSPYHDWFYWEPAWPLYRSFYDVPTMPMLRLSYGSPARAHLLEAAQKWLAFGVDGYRLDYANGPEHDFWVDFQRACRQVNPDAWTFGEVVQTADTQLSYAGGMNGTLDFLTCQALRETIALSKWSLSRLVAYLQASQAFFPADFSRPAFLDNHDMNRFFFIAGEDLRRLRVGLALLYLLPNAPIVLAGTLRALSQARSIHAANAIGFDESRRPMDWGEGAAQAELEAVVSKLSTLREAYPELVHARWQPRFVDDAQQLAVWQIPLRDDLFLVLNLSDQAQRVPLPPELSGGELRELLSGLVQLPEENCLRIGAVDVGVYVSAG